LRNHRRWGLCILCFGRDFTLLWLWFGIVVLEVFQFERVEDELCVLCFEYLTEKEGGREPKTDRGQEREKRQQRPRERERPVA
jgi:hypothetical protein